MEDVQEVKDLMMNKELGFTATGIREYVGE